MGRVAELERRLADARANLADTERTVEAADAALTAAREKLAEVSGDQTGR